MPYKSKAQQRWGNSPAGQKALGKKGVAEWNNATGNKRLPERLTQTKKQKSENKLKRAMKSHAQN